MGSELVLVPGRIFQGKHHLPLSSRKQTRIKNSMRYFDRNHTDIVVCRKKYKPLTVYVDEIFFSFLP